ncbi:MAG TPA: GNAT family N-acetyltransferase [Usitatibacter sp.]|nr:GNAT family N-acetyltransferase [Usitatibacter sp.]
MPIRLAVASDLPAVVSIYNASIPSRMATADVEPVTVAEREEWFREFDPARRPLWVHEHEGAITGWLGLRSYYGRPAYHRTVESAVYVDPGHRRRGVAHELLDNAVREAPSRGISNILAMVLVHNQPSVTLFEVHGFQRWGLLPRVCEIDGVERDVLILGRRV